MGLPQVRLTVQRLMAVVATLGVSWSMCLGIGHLTIYRPNVQGERSDKEEALWWETRQEPAKAAYSRRKAQEWARRNAESLAYIITAFSLVGLGVVLGGFGLAIKANSWRWDLVDANRADALANACLGLGTVVLAGLGSVSY
jgi:hypothetical protein